MFEAEGSQIQADAASSMASPTLSLQDFEAIYRMFQERAKDRVGPVEFEGSHLRSRISRNFSGQDHDGTCRMIEERRNRQRTQAGSASSMVSQISQPSPTCASGHLSQRNFEVFESRGTQTQAGAASFTDSQILNDQASGRSLSGYALQTNPEVFQSVGAQTQVGGPSFPACPISCNQSPRRSHFGYVSQTHPQMFQSTGAQTQALQLTGAQTQASAPRFPRPAYTILYIPKPTRILSVNVSQNLLL